MKYSTMDKKTDKTMVKQMRDIRDQVSLDIMDMTAEEQKLHLKKELALLKEKRAKRRLTQA